MDSTIPDNRVDEWAPGVGNFGYFARMEMNPLNPAPITAVCFDPFEELLWCGNYNGRVTSFYSTSFDRYTAFCAVGGDIRALEATESAIIVLSANNLKANTRHGLHSFQFSSSSMVNMCSLHRLPGTPSILMGGEQNKLIQFDIEKQRETRLTILKQKDATLIQSNGSNVFTADTEGKITVRLMSSLEALNVIPAHGGPITDFDVYGNKLITCGCSLRLNALHGDPYVKIYDLRTFRALPPLPLSFAPVFTRFIPTFCDSRIVIVSQMGQTQMTDLNERGVGIPMIIESDGYNLSAFDHSSTKHLMAFGDEIGNIHVYADRAHPSINESSWDTDFSDPSLGPPQSFTIDDTQTALSSVPLPFSTDDTYLSDWPEELCQPINRRQKHIPMYPSIKTIQFVGYAPNPRAHTPFRYFNIVPYHIEHEESRTSDIYEDNEPPVIPQFYRKLQLKRTRNGHTDDSTILKYNRTCHVPLESSASSTVVNPIVLILYHVPALRNLFLCHICEDEHCIACQLGFLFRMLSDKIPSQAAVQNINLVRSLMAAGSPPIQGEPLTTTQYLFTYIIESVEKVIDLWQLYFSTSIVLF